MSDNSKTMDRSSTSWAPAIAPPRLRLGDQIGVIAPSGPPLPQPLDAGLRALASAFRVKVAASASRPSPPSDRPFLAASDELRAAEANAMLADPDVRAIIMARGGYGLLRILPMLDAAALRADPKPIIGFSDGTALLSWAWHAGVRGIHGEVVVRLGEQRPEAIGDLVRALTEPTPPPPRDATSKEVAPPAPPSPAATTLTMIPSNLTMACHLVGTPWALPLDGSAWWMEDVGERPYEIDRCLTHLGLAGQLSKISGVVVGDLVRCMDPLPTADMPDDPRLALAVVAERLASYRIPWLRGAPFGHGRYNPPLPFGGRCRFDAVAGIAEILDGAVA
jgi:muramoyltetrapeptide carboxypeptidase